MPAVVRSERSGSIGDFSHRYCSAAPETTLPRKDLSAMGCGAPTGTIAVVVDGSWFASAHATCPPRPAPTTTARSCPSARTTAARSEARVARS